jgi:hypothetical protein
MNGIPLSRQVYRLHLAFVRKMNDVHIFTQQAIPLLLEAHDLYEDSENSKDRRYYVPSVGRTKFARRKDIELMEIYERFISRELYENLIVTAISQFESMLFEVVKLIINAYPQKLTLSVHGVDMDRNVSLEVLLRSGSLEEVFTDVIGKRINAISHARPQAYLDYLNGIAGITTSDTAFLDYIEIKASRDIIIHNAGIVNDVYLQKAGERARGQLNKKLVIDGDYFDHCIATLKRISGIIQRDIDKNFPAKAEVKEPLVETGVEIS